MTLPSGVHALVRRTHEDRVLQVLREHGAMTRGELAARIGLSRTTLSEITSQLLERGVISVSDDETPRLGRGRPAEKLTLDPAAGQYLGVDFGRRRVRIVVANAAHDLIASDVVAYDATASWQERIDAAFDLVDRMGADRGLHFDGVLGVGIGFPGPFSPRVPHEPSEPVAEARRAGAVLMRTAFAERFAAPVLLDNNTRLAGLAEATWDSAAEAEHLLYLRLSDGIGGGLVVGGRLVTGASGLAGEFGHISLGGHGELCRCGKRGCLETVASIGAILRRSAEAGAPMGSLEALAEAAAKGDPLVVGVLRDAGEAVGRVIGSLAVALNPSEIVVGGEVAQISEVILEQAAATTAYELLPVGEYSPRIRGAALGDEGGAIGGIIAIFQNSPLLAGYQSATNVAPAATRLRRSTT
ncbi:ROK family protein [Agromyces sp. NPDC058064]|uniref:ROK family transcriptional regulator n=1 Tax=Agromyces sp. NPDC058064 TaxID=3346322 RepID=UPI0036D7FEC6